MAALLPVACAARAAAPRAARRAAPARAAAPSATALSTSAAAPRATAPPPAPLRAPRAVRRAARVAAMRPAPGASSRSAAFTTAAAVAGGASGGASPSASSAGDAPPPTVESLTATHAIPGSVSFAAGPGGLLKAVLTHANGSSAEVHLQGATVTSYCQPSGDEVLFIRPDAVFDGSKPIAGGVPICFPIFGPGAMQQHGFARNSVWSVLRTCADVNPDYPEPTVTLKLTDSAATRAMWPFAFEALLEVTLRRDALKLEFKVRNMEATQAFDFTAALHSYFEVVDAALPAVRVTGLKGKTYLDKVPDPRKPARCVEDADAVRCKADCLPHTHTHACAHTRLRIEPARR
jgi:glucose-6-phosphate 1-epimerase